MRYLFIGGVVLIVFGIILAVIGFQEKNLASGASATAEEISLKDLIARGPDGNPNIILTDFVLCDNYVYKTRNGVWENAWVPAIPRQDAIQNRGGKPSNVKALIFTINARSQADLYQRCEQPKLRALVTNKIVSLGSQEREKLAKDYPGTDFSKCLIIQEGREPAGPLKLIFMIGGGSLLGLFGLGLIGLGAVLWLWRRGSSAPARMRRMRDDEAEDEGEEEDRPRKARRLASAEDEDEDEARKLPRSIRAEDGDDRPRKGPRERG
jgi:hypothetical protein